MRKNQNKLPLKMEVYQKLKFWDKKRAQILRYHKKASQQISQSIQKKVEDSKDFLSSLQTMLQERVNQLNEYCVNSVVDSELVFEKNKNEAYNNHYEFLKQIYIMEASIAQQTSEKLLKLRTVLNQLKGIAGNENRDEANEKESDCSGQSNKNDQSSLMAAKGDIKYLIQCELPEIVEKVIGMCQNVSKVYNQDQEKDLYFSIEQFVRSTYKQTSKHRQIGKSIISYVSTSIKRQITIQNKIRTCLEKWSEIDGPIDSVFLEQLKKKNPDDMIKGFYNIYDMTDVGFDENSIEDFLINFKIEQFSDHNKLKMCDIEGIYNDKILARVIITADFFVHLVRLNAYQPDFSFKLNPQLTIRRVKQSTVEFIQYKKKYYFKKQRQFEFSLELNNEQDLQFMKGIIEKMSEAKFQLKK